MGRGTERRTAEKMARKEVASRRSLMLPTCLGWWWWWVGKGWGGPQSGDELDEQDSEKRPEGDMEDMKEPKKEPKQESVDRWKMERLWRSDRL